MSVGRACMHAVNVNCQHANMFRLLHIAEFDCLLLDKTVSLHEICNFDSSNSSPSS